MYNGPYLNNTGLVFGYDTGIGVSTNNVATRLYPGEPTDNLHPNSQDASLWTGNLFGNWINSSVTTNVSVAPDGTLTADRLGDGYGRFNSSATAIPGQPYTYSVFLKNFSLTNNFDIVYAFGFNGSLVTYGGATTVAISQLSTSQWTRVTTTVTAPSSGINQVQFGPCPFTGYGNPSGQQIDVWGAQIEQKNRATPYVNGTRSSTQSLLDAKRATTIDLSTVSFNSSAQPIFDGTDDYIDLPTSVFPAMNQMTIELINFGIDARNSSIIAGGISGNQDLNIHLPWGDGNIYWDLGRPFNRVYKAAGSDYIGYHHWVFTKNPSTGIMNIYRDGALWAQNTGQTSSIISLDGGQASIGRYSNGSTNAYYHNGIVPVMRIYSVELTALQVAQNFQSYRSRFGI
jgi:hypothetical protein